MYPQLFGTYDANPLARKRKVFQSLSPCFQGEEVWFFFQLGIGGHFPGYDPHGPHRAAPSPRMGRGGCPWS